MNRNDPDSTSLELLLDTITNTFGGVLFLTMLVVLQLRTNKVVEATVAGNKSTSSSTDALREELHRRTDEVNLLKQVAGAQGRSMGHLTSGDAKKIFQQILEHRATLQELASDSSRSLAAIERETGKTEHLKSQLEDQRAKIALEQQRREELKRQMARERVVRTRTAELPTLRATEKREFPVVVRFGKLYTPYDVDPISLERSRHLDDFLPLGEENGAVRLTPNPLQGIPLDSSEKSESMLERLWNQFPKEHFYVCGAVWDDSFTEFSSLKSSLVAHGIEYRLIPTAAGDVIEEGSASGAFVQ
ncbi:hypothetical protein [Lacipirellula sp.]|uniref:hypothetical protein n=1 Tax=Lacipirellula sp. TaxID=2691419 RepID=UPI003D0E631D